MKKLLFAIVSIALVGTVNAQDAADKKFQAGLVFGAGMNFQKMGTKLMDKNGAGSNLLIGGTMNIMFNQTIGLNTGIEFNFNTSKYKPGGTSNVFYLYNDNDVEKYVASDANGTYEGKQLYKLDERKQQATYIMIPTMLVFRTNFIGYFRYFGKFGLNSGFLLTSKSNDTGKNYAIENANPSSTDIAGQSVVGGDNKNMKSKNEMFFFKSSVGIAGGAEWNFTGTTCLAAEIGFYYGITPMYYNKKADNSYLVNYTDVTDRNTATPFSNKATQSQLQLKISILF